MEKTEIDCSSVAEKSKSRSITHTMWSITTVCHPFWNLEFPWTSLFLMHSRLQWLAINLEIERTAFWPVKYCFSDHSQCCSEYYEVIQFGGCKCMFAYVAVRRVVASQEQTSWFCYLILQSMSVWSTKGLDMSVFMLIDRVRMRSAQPPSRNPRRQSWDSCQWGVRICKTSRIGPLMLS